MTVEATLPVIEYAYMGPGDYDFDFQAFHASDIKVTGIKDDIETYWEYLTDYTVTLGSGGGTVTTTRDSTEADSIRIMRVMPIQQPVDWVNGGPFDMDLLERNFDQTVMLIQQIQAELNLATLTNWRGVWQPQTEYSVRDLVDSNGSIYFCLATHTSSDSFYDDRDAGYWELFISLPDIGDIEDLVERAEQAAQEAEESAYAADQFAKASLLSAGDSQQAANESTTSAADSTASAGKSEEWAQNPEDAEVEPGEYSAYHWAQKAATFNPDSYYQKSAFITESAGTPDAGKPIVLNGSGKVDDSMIAVSGGFSYVGPFTPTAGAEYPDITGHAPGAYWDVTGVDDTNGYTFTGGDLTGKTVYNGDYMIYGSEAWSIIEKGELNPELYYRLDGTVAITGPFAGGNQQYHNLAAGTSDDQAVNLGQMNSAVAPKADTSYVDSQDAALQADIDTKEDEERIAATHSYEPYGLLVEFSGVPGERVLLQARINTYASFDMRPDILQVQVYRPDAWTYCGARAFAYAETISLFIRNGNLCIYLPMDAVDNDQTIWYFTIKGQYGAAITPTITETAMPTDNVEDLLELTPWTAASSDDLAAKADTSYVDNAVAPKADTTYVDSQDAAITDRIDPFSVSATDGAPGFAGDCNTLRAYSFVVADADHGATNLPPGSNYWYILTVPSAAQDQNVGQLAWTYAGNSLFAYRHVYSEYWSEWEVAPRMRADGDTLYIRDDGQAP